MDNKEEQKKVLIAEDSSVIRNLLKKVLSFEDFEITAVKDGQSCIDKFNEGNFDLILMDIHLPGAKNGLEATKEIRAVKKKKSSVPIIGISGNAKNKPVSEFFDAGMNEYLQKPLDYDKVVELVKKHLN